MLHFDTRSDNLRWRNGRLYLLDWPAARIGPPEIDVVALAESISLEGGPDPERLLTWYQEQLPLRPAAIDAALVGLAGYFMDSGTLPEAPLLPRLRRFQRAQFRVTLRWAAARLRLPDPQWLQALP